MRKYFFPVSVHVFLIIIFLLSMWNFAYPTLIASSIESSIIYEIIIYLIPLIILSVGFFYNSFIVKLVNVVLFIAPALSCLLLLIFLLITLLQTSSESNNSYDINYVYNQSATFYRRGATFKGSLNNNVYGVSLFRTKAIRIATVIPEYNIIRQELDIGFGLLLVRNVYEAYTPSNKSDLLELSGNTLRFINSYGDEETLILKPYVYF